MTIRSGREPRGAKALLWVLALSAAVAANSTALASERSELLYSRGLVEFHAQRHAQALALFEQAVQADRKDPYAVFYRGVTRGRMGDFDGAVADLRTALDLKPDFHEATLELGVALVQREKYRDAIPLLEQAQSVEDLEAHASLFLGLAQLRVGQKEEARLNFARAGRDPKLEIPATYYQGIIAYQEGQLSAASDKFSAVAEASPNTDMGREATSFLATIRRQQVRAYRVYTALGFEYDSNVTLAPSDSTVQSELLISEQSDGRTTITAGGRYAPWQTEHAQLSVGYEFYQSLHFDLSEFDLQDHRPSVQLIGQCGPFQLGVVGRYDYYLLDADSFLNEVTANPWVTALEGDLGRTDFYYGLRWRDFIQQPYKDLRDAVNHAVGLRQYFYLGKPSRYIVAGYQFDVEDPSKTFGAEFGYDGHQIEAGFGLPLPAAISLEATYTLRHEKYAQESDGRVDDEHQGLIALRKQLMDHLELSAAYFGTMNTSKATAFDYDRHIGSVTLEVSY